MADSIETEIKLAIPGGAAEALRLIEKLGCTPRTPRGLQIDQVYDRPDGALRNSRQLLRLRSEPAGAILTYKGPPLASRHKSREELETSITDPSMLTAILDRLGYVPTFRYEKFRTTFSEPAGAGVVALDETPIGVFIELEGPGYWIDQCALRLGFASGDYIVASYASLYREYLASHAGPADMIFSERNRTSGKEP